MLWTTTLWESERRRTVVWGTGIGGGGVGGGTSIDFTEILGTFGFFPENKFFGHPNYENCNIYPKNGDCDPKKQFFGTLEQVFEKSQKVWTVWYLRGVKTRGVLGGLTKITSNSVH